MSTSTGRTIKADERIPSKSYRFRVERAANYLSCGNVSEVLSTATDMIRQTLPWLGGIGKGAITEERRDTYIELVRSIQSAVEWVEAANDALQTEKQLTSELRASDPWTRVIIDETSEHCGPMPRPGEEVEWINEYGVRKRGYFEHREQPWFICNGDLYTPQSVQAWRYTWVSPPDYIDATMYLRVPPHGSSHG